MNEIESACRKAGQFQLTHFRSVKPGQITDKGLNQLVSFVDIESEKMLVEDLGKLTPGCRFITEEDTSTGDASGRFTWIIDPLDGTTNFLHGLGAFSISVALYENGAPVACAVYIPVWNEMFTASRGHGAWLNGEKIQVSDADSLKNSLIATGFPYYDFGHMQQYLSALHLLMKNTHGLRRMGSAAIDLAYTACGRFEGFFEYGLSAWDVAAGVLLIEEAGGKVSDISGGNDYIFGREILASCPGIFDEFYHSVV